jgi:hypothetical protein
MLYQEKSGNPEQTWLQSDMTITFKNIAMYIGTTVVVNDFSEEIVW